MKTHQPKFSKKTYEMVAATIMKQRAEYAPHWDPNLFRAMDDITRQFEILFQQDNKRFDFIRFREAAGFGVRK